MGKKQILLLFVFMIFRISSGSYIAHVQNYVNLVSAYFLEGHSTIDFPPLRNVSHVMTVTLSMSLYAINGFDEVAGNIELVSALSMEWTDEMPIIQSITFSKGNRDSFLVPYNMIWTPKLVLVNAVGETSEVGDSAYLCRFNMTNNKVNWKPRVLISASCTPDVTFYPFDKQSCEFVYTSWGFLSSEMMLVAGSDEWDQSEYGESGEWDISSTTTETHISNGQSYITFKISIIRKPLYFAFNILLPVLVLCLLNSTVFLLPAESGERVGFSVTCFLTFVVLLNMIMDIMPRSSSPISFLCYYLVVMMANSGAMTLVTILLMRVYHKPEKSLVPKWMQRTITFINCGCARLRCCVLCCRFIRRKCSCANKRMCGCSRKPKTVSEEKLNNVSETIDHGVENKSSTRFLRCLKCFAFVGKEKNEERENSKDQRKEHRFGKLLSILPCKRFKPNSDDQKNDSLKDSEENVTGKCKQGLFCISCLRKRKISNIENEDVEKQLGSIQPKVITDRTGADKKDFSRKGEIEASEKVLEKWEDMTKETADKKAKTLEPLDRNSDEKRISAKETKKEKELKLDKSQSEANLSEPVVDKYKTYPAGKNVKKEEPEVITDESDDEDSLADLEEEVAWGEVGRVFDTFFFLVFSGGQAFFTVVFLVPLFTSDTSSDD